MKPLTIDPPLLNSANPWCSDLQQLQELYACRHTGAVTTRTSLLNGFAHDQSIHQFTFYNASTHTSAAANPNSSTKDQTGSLNTLGYSPYPLQYYLDCIKKISETTSTTQKPKSFIISVTGSAAEVAQCYREIYALQKTVRMQLAMEINLSCPNIPGKPPPAYSTIALLEYLSALTKETAKNSEQSKTHGSVPIGIKTPPYTYHDQFKGLIDALKSSARGSSSRESECPISFITATNTLGSSLLLSPSFQPAINSANGAGIGGLAGAPLHPLALGNVRTIRDLLDGHEDLKDIQIIGVGGVEDAEGYERMRSVGAVAVGVGTALGQKGIRAFEDIGTALQKRSQSKL